MNNELILGISLFGHDSSATLVDRVTGKILYALTEERFSNEKHDGRFPTACIKNIETKIKEKNLGIIKYVAINIDKELFLNKIKIVVEQYTDAETENIIMDTIINSIDSMQMFHNDYYPLNFIYTLLENKTLTQNEITKVVDTISWFGNFILKYNNLEKYLQQRFKDSVIYSVPHHLCHVASSYYCSGFEEAVAMTIDGQGETETITLNYIKNNNITVLSKTLYPNSLGALYMNLTWYLGFDGHPKYPGFSDEFKVMGMSAYGNPIFLDIFRTFGDINEKGEFQIFTNQYIRLELVAGCKGHSQYVFTKEFYDEFGERRLPTEAIEQIHYDIAMSFQYFIEEIGVKLAKYLKKIYPNVNNICLAGGVTLNGLMNMQILEEAGFENIFIQPASGDDGTSLGAALYTKYNILNDINDSEKLQNAYLGIEYDDASIKRTLDHLNIVYTQPESIHEEIAKLLHTGYIVTRYFDRSEFGPRALGHRSILANPAIDNMKDIINSKIKHREPFRPFAPACLEEEAEKYFDIKCKSPYMLLICKAIKGVEKIIPAVIHDDGTARLQTVSTNDNFDFHNIISKFYELSGIPVLVNTSFNVNGETIVETPLDAIESALFMDVDYLAIGSYLVSIKENESKRFQIDRKNFLNIRKKRYLETYFCNELFLWMDQNPIQIELDILKQNAKMFYDIACERLEVIKTLDNAMKKKSSLLSKFWNSR